MTRSLLLIRHTEVGHYWRGRCYGASDAGLSRAGAAHAKAIAPGLAAWHPDLVVHSGLHRARMLAERIANHAGVDVFIDPAWLERDFGTWEGQTWNAIYRTTGNAMDGMIDAPDSFRPGGGETTMELADRVAIAYRHLPPVRVAIVSHGGPIATLRGSIKQRPILEWLSLVPEYGQSFVVGSGCSTSSDCKV